MATVVTQLPIAEYLKTSYKPDLDYVDGTLEERHVGEHDHGFLQSLLIMLFGEHIADWEVRPVTEYRVRVSPTRVRIPDIAILHGATPRESVAQTPPRICIEILSPEDRLYRAKLVLADYKAMGVQNIWLLDPIRQVAWTYDGTLHEVEDGVLTVPASPIRVELGSLFSRLETLS